MAQGQKCPGRDRSSFSLFVSLLSGMSRIGVSSDCHHLSVALPDYPGPRPQRSLVSLQLPQSEQVQGVWPLTLTSGFVTNLSTSDSRTKSPNNSTSYHYNTADNEETAFRMKEWAVYCAGFSQQLCKVLQSSPSFPFHFPTILFFHSTAVQKPGILNILLSYFWMWNAFVHPTGCKRYLSLISYWMFPNSPVGSMVGFFRHMNVS